MQVLTCPPKRGNSIQPLLDQPHQCPVIDPFLEHSDHPLMVYVVEEALDVRFHHIPVRPKLQLHRQVVHCIPCTHLRAISVAALQEVRLIDRFQDPFDR